MGYMKVLSGFMENKKVVLAHYGITSHANVKDYLNNIKEIAVSSLKGEDK